MGKDSFIFYRDWLDGLEGKDPELKAEVFEAIARYGLDGEEVELSPMASFAFGFIKPKIDRDIAKYEDKCRKLRENAKAKANNCKQMQANGSNCNQLQPKATKSNQIEGDNDNDNVNDNDLQESKDSMSKEKRKLSIESKERECSRRIFIPPPVDVVREYCESRHNGIDPEEFVSFYESKGWMIGKNRMKDWKAAVRTWEQKRKNESLKPQNNGNYISTDARKRAEKDARDAEASAYVINLLSTSRPKETGGDEKLPYGNEPF